MQDRRSIHSVLASFLGLLSANKRTILVAIVRLLPTRVRPEVTRATLHPGRDVHFVYFDRSNEIEGRRIERSGKALDAPVHRFVCKIKVYNGYVTEIVGS